MENFSGTDKKRVGNYEVAIEIMVCDFDIEQRIIAIGLRDGTLKVIDIERLCVNDAFTYGNESKSKYPSVTAINCRVTDKIIAGYEDGLVNEFSITNPSQPISFTFSSKVGESTSCFPVSHIEYSEKTKRIIAVFNIGKEAATIISYASGSTIILSTINHTTGSIIAMQLLERAQSLVTLSNFKNEIAIYDYVNGDQLVSLQVNIEKVTYHNPLTTFALLPVTQQIKLKYENPENILKKSTQESKGDIIALGMMNGTILVAYLSLKFDKGKVIASIIPQQLYKSKASSSYEAIISSLYIDPVTDHIVVGDVQGNILMLENAVMQVLNPEKVKKSEYMGELDILNKGNSYTQESSGASGSKPEPVAFEMVERKVENKEYKK